MTISDTTTKKSATGGVTDYSFPFRVLADTDLLVYTEDTGKLLTLKTLTTDYTVTFVTGVEGGTVVFNSAVSGSLNVLIVRATPDVQGTDYEPNGRIPADDVELGQDKATMLAQQALEVTSRSLRVPANYTTPEIAVTPDTDGYSPSWNSTTEEWDLVSVAAESAAAAVSADEAAASAASVNFPTPTVPDAYKILTVDGAGSAWALSPVTVDASGNMSGIGTLVTNGTATFGGFVCYSAHSELTIASGAITATKSYHTIDTEGGAGTDDLEDIDGGVEGCILIVQAENSGRTVVCKDAVGNLQLAGDFSLTAATDKLTLIKFESGWHEVSRSDNNA